MILIRAVEFDEVTAPSPNANDQVAIFFRIFLRVKESIAVYGVDLHLRAAPFDEKLNEAGDFFEPVVERKNGIVQFERQRAAVDDAGQIGFREGRDGADRAANRNAERRSVICRKRFAAPPPVRRRREFVRVPKIIHRRTGSGSKNAAARVASPFPGIGEIGEKPNGQRVRFRLVVSHFREPSGSSEEFGGFREPRGVEIRVENGDETFRRNAFFFENEPFDREKRVDRRRDAGSVNPEIDVFSAGRRVASRFDAPVAKERNERARENVETFERLGDFVGAAEKLRSKEREKRFEVIVLSRLRRFRGSKGRVDRRRERNRRDVRNVASDAGNNKFPTCGDRVISGVGEVVPEFDESGNDDVVVGVLRKTEPEPR